MASLCRWTSAEYRCSWHTLLACPRARSPLLKSPEGISSRSFPPATAFSLAPFTFGKSCPFRADVVLYSLLGLAKVEATPRALTCTKTLRKRPLARSTISIVFCRLLPRICRKRLKRKRRRNGQRKAEGMQSWAGAVSRALGRRGCADSSPCSELLEDLGRGRSANEA